MANKARLSAEDVTKLLENPSAESRVEMVEKVSGEYLESGFTKQQMDLAERIFRVLAHDAEIKVRKALAESLKESTTIPKDIIMDMVKDVDQVALPVLEFSTLLTDEDLVAIIRSTQSGPRLTAISNRKTVSDNVSTALIDTRNESAVSNLMSRDEVKISEENINKVLEHFPKNERMLEKVINRSELPVAAVEKLIGSVSDALKEQLIERFGNEEAIKKAVSEGRERATMKFMGLKEAKEGEVKDLVEELGESGNLARDMHLKSAEITEAVKKLGDKGKLSPISSICMGHMGLFEVSLARITGIPVANIRKLLLDSSGHGFKALYDKAHLPDNIYDAMWLIFRVMSEMEKESPGGRKPANALITRVLMRAEAEDKEVANLSYFISMIHQHAKITPKQISS